MDKRPKILSIDHDPDYQAQLQRALEQDYQVTTALSGMSGIEALCLEHPDAILLDVDMPSIDGLKLCRMIRAEPSFDHTPILMVLNQDNQDAQLKAFSAGGNDFVCRLYNIEELKNKLNLSIERLHNIDSHTEAVSASNDYPGLDQNLETLHDFLIHLLNVQNTDQLAKLVQQALSLLGLQGAICFHQPSHKIISSIGPLTDLESLLLQQARQPYPSEYSARYIWGSTHLAALIQNMPYAKSELYQALVDILATLMRAANEKLKQLCKSMDAFALTTPSATPRLDLQKLQMHKQRLAALISHIEELADDCLSEICHQLQDKVNQFENNTNERRPIKKLFNQCIKTRVVIYDQCLEANSELEEMMQTAAVVETPEAQI